MKHDRPLRDLHWTWDDLACKIDSEGFDYYFTSYQTPEEFFDPRLKKLALEYRDAHDKLVKYLRSRGGLIE